MDRLQVSKRHTTFSNMTSTYLQPFERYTIKIGEKKVLSLELLQLLNRSSDQFAPKNKFFLHKMDNNHASLFFFYCPRFSRKKKNIQKYGFSIQGSKVTAEVIDPHRSIVDHIKTNNFVEDRNQLSPTVWPPDSKNVIFSIFLTSSSGSPSGAQQLKFCLCQFCPRAYPKI